MTHSYVSDWVHRKALGYFAVPCRTREIESTYVDWLQRTDRMVADKVKSLSRPQARRTYRSDFKFSAIGYYIGQVV